VGTSERFAELVQLFAGRPGVLAPDATAPRRFGSDALKVDGAIFAMVTLGHLVVKLPGGRVAELIAGGAGSPFDAGKGRPLTEWVVVESDDLEVWARLAAEAEAFVGGPGR
jgi:TfoX/Sxy family transcriptional regulator of competence genes